MTADSGWLHLQHEDETIPPARVPDDPAVREAFEARGFRVVDEPADQPFVSPVAADLPTPAVDAIEGAEVDGNGQAWVELVHPLDGVDGQEARSRVPADPVVVDDFLSRGWVLPRKTDGGVPAAAVKAARKAAAERQDSDPPDEPAARAANENPESPATARGSRTSGPSGQGDDSGPADTASSTAADTKEQ